MLEKMTKKQKTRMGICFLLTFGTFMSQQVFADDSQAIESNLKQQAADPKKAAQDAQNAENKLSSEFKGWHW